MTDDYNIDDNGGQWFMDEGMGPNLDFDKEEPEDPLDYESPENMLSLDDLKSKKKNKKENINSFKFFEL